MVIQLSVTLPDHHVGDRQTKEVSRSIVRALDALTIRDDRAITIGHLDNVKVISTTRIVAT